MSYAERRRWRMARARMKACVSWCRKMGKRRGGFVVVPIGATDEARAEIRAWGMRGMRIMRFTNLPAGLRVAFEGIGR